MAVTITGAIKGILTGLVPVYRDIAEESAPFPRVVVTEGISTTSALDGDQGDGSYAHTVDEEVQVSLHQLARDATTNAVTEDPLLAEQIVHRLTTTPFSVSGRHVYRCRHLVTTRLPDNGDGVVHQAIRLRVHHSTAT